MGFLLLCIFMNNVCSGVVLAFYYIPDSAQSFIARAFIGSDVSSGWLAAILHSYGANVYMWMMYAHIIRNLWHWCMGRHSPLWLSGFSLLLSAIAEAFVGYTLPGGNMGFHGSIVAMSIVGSAAASFGLSSSLFDLIFCSDLHFLMRFFAAHWMTGLLIGLIIGCHTVLLHAAHSSSSAVPDLLIGPTSIRGPPMAFALHTLKYLLTFPALPSSIALIGHRSVEFWNFGNSDNWIAADPLVTPMHIVPEWYLLTLFGFIRALPVMLLGLVLLIFVFMHLLACSIRDSSATVASLPMTSAAMPSAALSYDHAGLQLHSWFRIHWVSGCMVVATVSLSLLSSLPIHGPSIGLQRSSIMLLLALY